MQPRSFQIRGIFDGPISSYIPSDMLFDMPQTPSWGDFASKEMEFQQSEFNNPSLLNSLSPVNQANLFASAKQFQIPHLRHKRSRKLEQSKQNISAVRDLLENFEPGFPASPGWRPTASAEPLNYPTTPNYRKWLKCSPSPVKAAAAAAKIHHIKTSKLGPERYKSMRVTEPDAGNHGAAGETIETFFDPRFNNQKKPMFVPRSKV